MTEPFPAEQLDLVLPPSTPQSHDWGTRLAFRINFGSANPDGVNAKQKDILLFVDIQHKPTTGRDNAPLSMAYAQVRDRLRRLADQCDARAGVF